MAQGWSVQFIILLQLLACVLAANKTKIFVIGGSPSSIINKTAIFDFETNKWSDGIDLPTFRFDLVAATLYGEAYAIGGYGKEKELNTVDTFNFNQNKWTPTPPMNQKRSLPGVGVFEDNIYVVGGLAGGEALSSGEVFDPKSKKWAMLDAEMNTTRFGLGVGVLSGYIYAVGGSQDKTLNSVERFDTKTNTWSFVAPMQSPRYMHCVAVLNGKLYAIGGAIRTGAALNSVEVYDPVIDQWAYTGYLQQGRNSAGAVVYDGKIYVFGGYSGSQSFGSMEVFDPSAHSWSVLESAKMPLPRTDFGVTLISVSSTDSVKFEPICMLLLVALSWSTLVS